MSRLKKKTPFTPLTFLYETVDKILRCGHLDEKSSAVLSFGAV